MAKSHSIVNIIIWLCVCVVPTSVNLPGKRIRPVINEAKGEGTKLPGLKSWKDVFAVGLIVLSLSRDICQPHEQEPATAHRLSMARADTAHKPCTGSFWKMGPKCCAQSRDTWIGHGAGNNSWELHACSSFLMADTDAERHKHVLAIVELEQRSTDNFPFSGGACPGLHSTLRCTDRYHRAAGRHFPQAGRSVQSCWSSHPLRVLTAHIKMYRRSQIAFLTPLWFKIPGHFQQVLTSDDKKEQTKRSSLSLVLRYILYQSIKEINIPIINLAYSPYRDDGWLPCEYVKIKALCSPRDFGSIRHNAAQTTLM